MRPDCVLIACEALGLYHEQATQASSKHIVIYLAALFRVLACEPCNYDDDFPSVLAGDNDLALGACPASAGEHRPRTYAE